jgi:hypothetical protein
MTLELRRGETIELKGRRMTVTATAWDSLPRVRDHLIEVGSLFGGDAVAERRELYDYWN